MRFFFYSFFKRQKNILRQIAFQERRCGRVTCHRAGDKGGVATQLKYILGQTLKNSDLLKADKESALQSY
mgnify:CR=1 FL=1